VTEITATNIGLEQSCNMHETSTLARGDTVSKHESHPDVLVFQFGDVQLDVPFEIGCEYAKAVAAHEEHAGVLHFASPSKEDFGLKPQCVG